MSVFDVEKLEEVLKQRKKFDYSTQPIEFLWGYDSTLIEAVPKLIERIRELKAENEELKSHCEWLEQNLHLKNVNIDDLRWKLGKKKNADCP